MKNLFTLSAAVGALFFTVPVYAMEVSADTSKTVQEYSGNARIMFKPDEKFDIAADKTSKLNDITAFSGNVIVTFKGGTLKTDAITVKKQADGAALLEAKKFSLERTDIK